MTAPRIPDLPASFAEGDIPELPSSFGPRPLSETLRSLTTPAPIADVTAQEVVKHEVGMFDPNRATKLEALRHRARQGLGQAPSIGPENVEETSTSQELGRFLSLRSDSDWWRRINTFDRMSSSEDPTGATSTLRGLVSGPGRMMQSLLGPTAGEAAQGIGSALTLHPSDAVSHGISALTGTGRLATGFASGLVNGFVTDVVRLDYDRHHGGHNLLPEERQQMQKNVVMNYGGLVIGGAARGTVLENQAMNQLAREAGVSSEVLNRVLTPPELEHLTSSVLSETNGMRLGFRGRVTAGIQEGAIGGAGGAALAGERPGDVLAYGLMAAPLGLAFEMFGAAKHVLGDAPSTARDYLRLRSLQAIDDLSASSAAQASLSLGDHPDVARLWAFNAERQPGDVMVMTGVDRVNNERVKEILDANSLHYAIHENPHGALDLYIGDQESLAQAESVRKGFTDTGFAPHEIVMYQGRPHVVSSIGRGGDVSARTVILHEVGTGRPTEPILASELSRPPRSDFAEPPMQFRTELSQTKAVGEDGKPLEFYRGIPDPSRPYEPTQYDGRYGKGIYFSTSQETASAYARFYVPNGSEPIRAGLTDAERTAAIDFANQQYRAAITGNRPEMTPEAAAAMSKLGQTPVVTRARLVMKNPVEIDGDLMVNVDNGELATALSHAAFIETNATVKLLANRLVERLRTTDFEPKYYDLQNVFEGATNKILADMGYDGLVIKNGEILADETWGVAFEDKAITSPWTESELFGHTTLPNEAAVSSRLDAIADAAISSLKERLDTTEPIDFDNLVQNLAATVGAKASEVPFLSNLIEKRLGEALIPELLDAREMQVRRTLLDDLAKIRFKEKDDLVNNAMNSGFLVEREGGGVSLREMKSGDIVGHFSSTQDAAEFVKQSGAAGGVHLDGPPGNIPPRVVGAGMFDAPLPEGGPHTVSYTPEGYGWTARLRSQVNLRLGAHPVLGVIAAVKKEWFHAIDNTLHTELDSKVFRPLQKAELEYHAAMAPVRNDIQRLSNASSGLGKEGVEHITTALETQSAEELRKNYTAERGLSEHEVDLGQWAKDNNVDIERAMKYRRELINSGVTRDAAIARRVEKMGVTQKEIEFVDMINDWIDLKRPNDMSTNAAITYALALQRGQKTFAEFTKSLGDEWTAQKQALRDDARGIFDKIADEHGIPTARRLTGYMAHYRKFGIDEAVPSRGGPPRFVSDLWRVGEMSEYDRDFVSVLMRYASTAYGEKYRAPAIKEAMTYLNEMAKDNPTWGPPLRQKIIDNYINEVRGIPKDDVAITQAAIGDFTKSIGAPQRESTLRKMANVFNAVTSSSALGMRGIQAVRDFTTWGKLALARVGPNRVGRMFTIINEYTPKDLYEMGVIKQPPQTVAGLHLDLFGGPQVAREMAEQGVIATNSPIAVLSAGERQEAGILSRAGKFRQGVQAIADLGMKWSFQHTFYQWAHAAMFLEGREFNGKVLSDFAYQKITEKQMVKKLRLSTYEPSVQQQFIGMVNEGKFEEARDYLSNVTTSEVIPTYGLANAPTDWTSTAGRVYAQFGYYPTYARSQIARMLVQGTARDRLTAAAWLALGEGATKIAGAGLGVSLASWYLPYTGGVVQAIQAWDEYAGSNGDRQKLAKAVAMSTVGVVGSGLYMGGPATSAIRASVELGDNTPYNDSNAVQQLARLWILGVPYGLQGRDLIRAINMQQQGYNPLPVVLQAAGLTPVKP